MIINGHIINLQLVHTLYNINIGLFELLVPH
nr:MAG TPA: hypothetical protein [Bacteriophage sp.]